MKSALITGGASGIGKACCLKMAEEGYGVVVADVNLQGAQAVADEICKAGGNAIAVRMDVSDEKEVEDGFDRMTEAFGSCDLVMSNAGVQIVHPFEEYPFEDWKKMMAIHADGVFTTVEDVANTLAFLAKDQGALTGQSLRLTHGWAMA